jgi:transcriptional regulator with GAF, ATPase, and Fis domain
MDSTAHAGSTDTERLRRERDLYLRLLQLGQQTEPMPFLRDALALIVELTGARRAYLELDDGHDGGTPWSIAHELSEDEIADVRSALSRGIIAEALATGDTVVTPSAWLDPRFRERGSVRIARIEAVLCAPIGADTRIGVLYLHGNGPFSDDDRATAETFARHLAPLADRLLRAGLQRPDPTAAYRDTLRAAGVVGRSEALATLLRQVALVAPLDVHVLLTGESGTGKSLIARVIHDSGARGSQPFVELNCAALPESLLESELFGALPGAHSTATRRMEGKVAAAEHGTLFLDEIGELSLTAQAKLLHLLQSKQYYPLGGSKPVTADVRVIAATNSDLQAAVAEHRFREDLFYRLQILPVRVPAVAERRQDVADLARHFCEEACQRHTLPSLELSRGAIRAAEAAEWPGNVRQLAHAIEAAAIRAAGERAVRIEVAHLFPDRVRTDEETAEGALTFQEGTRRFQARFLRDALEEAGWNIAEVARRLDLARSHVYNLIRAFGIERARH